MVARAGQWPECVIELAKNVYVCASVIYKRPRQLRCRGWSGGSNRSGPGDLHWSVWGSCCECRHTVSCSEYAVGHRQVAVTIPLKVREHLARSRHPTRTGRVWCWYRTTWPKSSVGPPSDRGKLFIL
jgi:hypothetical protein